MKHLSQCINESLLDDEDEIMAKELDRVVEDYLDRIFAYLYKSKHVKNVDSVKFIEDTLHIKGFAYAKLDYTITDLILELHKARPFDEISVAGGIEFYDDRLLDGKTIKTVRAKSVTFYYQVHNVTGVDFDLSMSSEQLKTKFVSTSFSITFDNVNVYMNGGSIYDRMRFASIPILKKFNATKVWQVSIYSPSLFDHSSERKQIESFFDTDYKYEINIGGKVSKRKGDLKTIVATVNNPRKYMYRFEGNPFKIRPTAKIKDLINTDMFDDELKVISFSNNNVIIKFNRKDSDEYSGTGTYSECNLPNDPDWKLCMFQR